MADTKELTPEQAAAAAAEEAKTAEIRELLKRYGLKRALVDKKTGDVHFDETYIKRLDAKAHTEITAE